MRIMTSLSLAAAATLLCVPALAAELTGQWNATINSDFGAIEMMFDLTADGEELTGTVSAGEMLPATKISEGMIDGDSFSFKLEIAMPGGPAMTIDYAGIIADDELSMKSTMTGMPGAEGQVTEFTAERAE